MWTASTNGLFSGRQVWPGVSLAGARARQKRLVLFILSVACNRLGSSAYSVRRIPLHLLAVVATSYFVISHHWRRHHLRVTLEINHRIDQRDDLSDFRLRIHPNATHNTIYFVLSWPIHHAEIINWLLYASGKCSSICGCVFSFVFLRQIGMWTEKNSFIMHPHI